MRFEKVKREAFVRDVISLNPHLDIDTVNKAYEEIILPERGTENSAGYDIRTPLTLAIQPNERRIMPTGIKAVFNDDELGTWHVQMYVRSSVGIKKGVVLMNGTGIIDPDYQFADNDGDMMLALWNTSENTVVFARNDRICQAVFEIHGRTSDDNAFGKRTGGVGSTGR